MKDILATIIAIALVVLGVAALAFVSLAFCGFLVWLVWEWVVADVFASAVAAGTVPRTLTYWQAIKLSILSLTIIYPACNSAVRNLKRERKE